MIKRNNEMLFRQLQPPLLLALLLTLAYLKGVISVGVEKLSNPSEFMNFVSNVNRGTTYSGTTVFLTSDLSFSGKTLGPIGTSSSYCFRGVFDGQGHVIRNLAIRASLQHVGLFGYSEGLTIRNVVLDSTCTITSTYSSTNYVGGIIGYCYASNDYCNIYNSVNMASVTFSGSSSGSYLYLGGIAGYLYSSSSSGYQIYLTNCANYGLITHSGTSSNSYLGGIVGYSENPPSWNYLYNCLNYGTITHKGSTTYLYLGGIAGCTDESRLYNCLSIGAISMSAGTSSSNYKGAIVGYVYSSTGLYYCYFTSNVGISSYYSGYGNSPSISNTPSSSTTISTAVSNLNSYSSRNGWNKWLLITNSARITFKYNDNTAFSLSSQVIILPVLLSYGNNSFKGWFRDTSYSETFTPESISAAATLYGLYGEVVTVTFNGNGGSISQQRKYVTYNYAYNTLPTPYLKTGYTFVNWFNEDNESVTSGTIVKVRQNHALYANWTANTYTVTFYAYGGGGIPASMPVVYDSEYRELPTPNKTGYTFLGWFDGDGEDVTNKTKVTTPENHALHARWIASNYTVALNASGGEVTPPSMSVIYDSEYGKLPEPNRTGYTFAGWFNESNESVTSGTTVENPQNHTLHARWIANNYTVALDADGGGGILTSMPVVFDSAYGDLPTPNRTGYMFAGWFTETPGGDLVNSSTIVTSPHDHTIYAHWNPILYTTSFDTNGGSACENISQSYGTCLTLPKSEKTGYAFIGWFDTGLATEYTAKTVQAVNITLYAKWKANTYNVSFDEDCGIYNESVSVAFDSTYDLPEPPDDDTAILWWDVEETGGRVVDGDKVSIADDITLCAVWKTNPVALNASGGDVSPATVNATYNETYGVLPIPEMAGYSFLGWFNETGGSVTNETTVTTPKSHTLYAQWTINHYTITFDFGGGKTMSTTQRYGDVIIYPNEVPSKSFRKFREWCTRDVTASSKTCNVTHVPANDLTFTPSFGTDSSLLTGVSFAIIPAVLAIVLLVVVLVLVIVVRKMKRDYEPVDIELDEENDESTVNRANERVEARIFQQVGAMKISNSFAKSLKNSLKKAEKNKGLDETLADLGVERIDDESDDVIESFRTNGAVQTSIASAAHKKENLVAVAEYLRLLYVTAREQEEYKEFNELYFGMKSIDNFMDKVDEKTIGFGGVVSGFTSKRKAVQFLMSRANEKEEDGIDMPSGVLFKVKKGRGYKIGKLDEETDEVLLEINSVFKVESVREVTKDRFITVTLSFISPITEDELIKM